MDELMMMSMELDELFDDRGAQGYCRAHVVNPHHGVITANGWKYSHTTIVTAIDGSKYAIHTYKLDVPYINWNVSVECRPGWRVESGRGGSNRRHVMYTNNNIHKYLNRKRYEFMLDEDDIDDDNNFDYDPTNND